MTGDRVVPDAAILRSEAERVCASADFARAPVMRRLLMFLTEQTIAGKGDDLKAYGVAVDGLGRPADFDPQADSYPRVQVGRLRRVLDQHYQQHGYGSGNAPSGEESGGGGRLILYSGSYRLHWEPADAARDDAVPEPAGTPDAPPVPSREAMRWRWPLIALAMLVLVAIVGWVFLHARSGAAPGATVRVARLPIPSPDIMIEPIKPVEQADPVLAQRVSRILADALPRGWLLTVRSGDRSGRRNGYRLTGTLVGAERKLLYLALWDIDSRTQIWSQRMEIDRPDTALRATLNPTIATLISPFGVIGTRERRLHAQDYRAGFPCMMRYSAYYTSGDRREAAPVRQCLDETLRLDPGYGPAMAARIIMLYRAGMAHPERTALIRREALTLAKAAVDADPYSPDAQLALGLAAYSNGLCEQGRKSALRALELNPYDAYAQGRAGLQMFQCGDADFQPHLEMAWQLDPALPSMMAMPIIITRAEKGEGRAALRYAQGLSASEGQGKPGYAMTMAVAHAGAADIAGARAYWREAAIAAGADPAAPPQTVLRRIVFMPGLARRIEAYLRARGTFAQT